MKIGLIGWLAALSLLATALLSGTDVLACTVKFEADTTDFPSEYSGISVECGGPYARTSGCNNVDPGQTNHQFYCADETIFSMYGSWNCSVYNTANCVGGSVDGCDFEADKSFKVGSSKDSPVVVKIEDQDCSVGISVSESSSSDSLQATGFLGDSGGVFNASQRDTDTHTFAAEAGEMITVSLRRDGDSGSEGDTAILMVKDSHGKLLAEDSGMLPLELDVLAFDAGELGFVVRSAPNTLGDRFRGHYNLGVTLEFEPDERVLVPQKDVEP